MMIVLPRLSESDLGIFKNKKVVLYATNEFPLYFYRALTAFEKMDVVYCIENISFRNYMKIKANGVLIKIISPKKLSKYLKKDAAVIIQSLDSNAKAVDIARCKAVELGVEFSPLSVGEILNSFSDVALFKALKNPLKCTLKLFYWKYLCAKTTAGYWTKFKKAAFKAAIVICSPPKTADITLNYTFNAINDTTPHTVNYINLMHRPRLIDAASYVKENGVLKIITGVREPIAQNLSRLFQDISSGQGNDNFVLAYLEHVPVKNRKNVAEKYEELFVKNGRDVQLLWDAFVSRYVYEGDCGLMPSVEAKTVQQFIGEFKDTVVDILAYPFDKEKGYAIIKEGNIEIFVYQLEKLNDLIPMLSDWVGVPFDKLENGNQASDKWISESYKQAQKEIEITQEYFDRCFDEPYVKHCYSEADIEKFKAKWRPHIKR